MVAKNSNSYVAVKKNAPSVLYESLFTTSVALCKSATRALLKWSEPDAEEAMSSAASFKACSAPVLSPT